MHGLLEQMVTDNGLVFTSQEFKEFMQSNSIDHIRVLPYRPSSNGLAEQAVHVQVLKLGRSKMKEGTLACHLAKVLFSYTIAPHSTTGVPPAVFLMERPLRSR